ncbi:MAG: hypothetical protein K6G92_00020 [Bacteroidaceae bacterium]|nr:hypothetical protein [Bacteroidaceae bacterium]
MKARTVICMIITLMALIGSTAYGNNSTSGNDNGQKTYKPMLKDGRVWNCIELWGAVNLDTLKFEYRIDGTIEKDGHVCYKLYQGSKQIGLFYEEGPKVFYYTENGGELLFDFSLSPGEFASEYYMVDEVKTIVMKGEPRRCLFFPWALGDGTKECWIEGVGNSKTGPYYPYFLDFFTSHTISISYRGMKLMSVYDGDVCIFESDDLMANPAVEINEENFPDENFRNWVLSQEYGKDGVLTEEEIAEVTRMDLSTKKILNLKGIEFFTELTWLNCTNNQLTEIDLSKCTKLEHFDCNWTQLTELNMSKNIALTELTCSYNKLHSLDVSKNKALIDLRCGGNQLTTLDVSNNSALEVLFCNENQLTELDLSMNSAIKRVWCSDNELTSLNVSGCVVLESLKCGRNRLKSLVLTNCAGLWELYCESNQINGKAMDEMVESLPILINIFGIIHVINHQNEQNVMTKTQVAAAKAKGWNPRYNDGTNYWNDYEGSEDPVTFTKYQMATIILPTEPDASKGKYYRLDRCEDGQIIFEQELQPQARVPYIIVPNEDFSIDPSTLDLEGLTQDEVSIEGVSFIGSYHREELPALTGGDGEESSYIDLIDTTPDCGITISAETGKETFLIGALRAYLIVSWDDPINPGGARSPKDKLEIVLKDHGTSVGDAPRINDKGQMKNDIYNLAGQRVDNSKLPRGIYIEDKKKVFKK